MPKNLQKNQLRMDDFAGRPSPRTKVDGGPGGVRGEAAAAPLDVASAALPAVQEDRAALLAVLAEVKETMAGVSAVVDRVSARLEGVQNEVAAHATRLQEVEARVGALEDALAGARKMALQQEAKMKTIEARAEDQEARSRRNNVRIIGLRESFAPGKMAAAIARLIREALPEAALSEAFIVERAHRALQGPPPPGAPPRAVIARILNYADRDAILRSAREKGPINLQGDTLSFFPDFTRLVQQQRRAFQDIKHKLRSKGIKYSMMYPAKMRIELNGRAHFCDDVDQVAALLGDPEAANKTVRRRGGEGRAGDEAPKEE